MQMPVLLTSIIVISGQVLLNSAIIDLFRTSDLGLKACCFLQIRKDYEVLS